MKDALDSLDDLAAAHRNADHRVTLGALLCGVGVLWLISAGMLSNDIPLALVLSVALLPLAVGARLLVRGALRVDAIDAIVADGRASVRKSRRKSARIALRERRSLA